MVSPDISGRVTSPVPSVLNLCSCSLKTRRLVLFKMADLVKFDLGFVAENVGLSEPVLRLLLGLLSGNHFYLTKFARFIRVLGVLYKMVIDRKNSIHMINDFLA